MRIKEFSCSENENLIPSCLCVGVDAKKDKCCKSYKKKGKYCKSCPKK